MSVGGVVEGLVVAIGSPVPCESDHDAEMP